MNRKRQLLLLVALWLVSTMPAGVQGADRLAVVATTPDLAAVARAVGGDNVEVTALARPGEDAHFVDAKPSFVRLANRADVLIEGGASLEVGWLPAILDSARNPRLAAGAPGRVVAAQGVPLVEVPTDLDRSLGDVHPQGNPHFLLDPVLARIVAQTIQAAFCAVDAARCDRYEAGRRTFQETIDARLPVWQAALAPLKGTKVVTYHRDFEYFFRRFGLETAGTLEPKPGIPPSPAHLTQLIEQMRARQVRLVVIEPFRERGNPDLVADKTGARVLALPTMPADDGPGAYFDLIDGNVRQLVDALKPAAPAS